MRRIVWVVAVMVGVLLVVAVVISMAMTWPPIGSFLYDYRWWSFLVAGVAVIVLLLVLLGKLLRSPWGSPWRAQVLATADALEGQFSALSAGAAPGEQALYRAVEQAVQCHLKVAKKAAWPEDMKRLPVGQQLLDWWTGGDIERAFMNLHEAEIALAQLLPDDQIQARIPEVLARLQTMDVTDPRRQAAETQLGSNPTGSQTRAVFHRALRLGLELKDEQHVRLRSFRNIVVTTAVGLMVFVVTLCGVGVRSPDAIPLCFGPPPIPVSAPGEPPAPVQGYGVACPSEESPPTPGTQGRRLPAPGDVTLAALFGLLGGGLSAAITIRNLQRNYRAPLDIPVALTLLKLPSGALSALIGLLFIRGEFIPGMSQLDSQQQILAYAFLFGIAQWLITRTVDQQAEAILAKMPSEALSGAPEPSPPAEGLTGASGRPG